MKNLRYSAPVLALLFALTSAACSGGEEDSSPPPCNEDPWSCPTGQTCSPIDAVGSEFACVNSGPGQFGDACLGVVGSAECADGLACNLMTPTDRTCTAYCDPTDPARVCPDGGVCFTAQTSGGRRVNVCQPASSSGSGQMTGSGGSTSSGASTELPEGWSDLSLEERCAQADTHISQSCGGEPSQDGIDFCLEGYAQYEPIGCGAANDAYVACTATAELDCFDPCAQELEVLNACEANFTLRTGCERMVRRDSECSAESPYLIQCPDSEPVGCVPVGENGFCCAVLP